MAKSRAGSPAIATPYCSMLPKLGLLAAQSIAPAWLTRQDFMCREHASAARSFLQATAKGFEWAASHPDEAAQLLVQAVAKDTKADPLPEPLDLDMVKESQRLLSKVLPGTQCHASHACMHG